MRPSPDVATATSAPRAPPRLLRRWWRLLTRVAATRREDERKDAITHALDSVHDAVASLSDGAARAGGGALTRRRRPMWRQRGPRRPSSAPAPPRRPRAPRSRSALWRPRRPRARPSPRAKDRPRRRKGARYTNACPDRPERSAARGCPASLVRLTLVPPTGAISTLPMLRVLTAPPPVNLIHECLRRQPPQHPIPTFRPASPPPTVPYSTTTFTSSDWPLLWPISPSLFARRSPSVVMTMLIPLTFNLPTPPPHSR